MKALRIPGALAGLLFSIASATTEPSVLMTSEGKPPGPAVSAIETWFTAGREISCLSKGGIDGVCGLDRVNAFRVFYDKAEERAVVFATWSPDTGKAVSLAVAQFARSGEGWSLVRNLRLVYGEGQDALEFTGMTASFTMRAFMPTDARCCLTGTQRYSVELQTGRQ